MKNNIHLINDVEYIETNEKPEIGDYVISSEQIGLPRIYKVFHITNGKLVLGKYSNGHTGLSNYKTLKPKNK